MCAIELALILQELVAVHIGLEVAPHDMAVIAVHAHIEAARCWRIFDSYRIVTVDRVIIIRVDALQEIARVFFVDALEDILETVFRSVQCGCENGAASHLALEVECKAAFLVDAFVFTRIARLHIAFGKALAQCEVSQAHIEPVVVGDIDIARKVERVFLFIP